MKITNVEIYQVRPRWMLVKISTDEGITGWGEPTLDGKATVVEEMIHVFSTWLIGEDPDNIEALYNRMYRGGFYRGGGVLCSAISGIEQALWDIKGKKLGVPIWQLLGGRCRDRVRMYAHAVPFKDDPSREELQYWVKKRVDDGFTALKTSMVNPPIRHVDTWKKVEEIVSRIAVMRETAGNCVDIAIDFHGRVSPAMAPLLMKELEPYHPMFVEEPVLPENVDVMKEVSQKTVIPIAAGERLFTTFGFRELIDKRAVHIIQPDLCHCGGILQGLKIAAMAANQYISVAPHNPLGPVALAACLQLDTAISNFTAQEHPTHEEKLDLGVGLLKNPFVIQEGYIDVPKGPGLGIDVDEYAVKELQYDGNWANPVLYFEDDHSMGEW